MGTFRKVKKYNKPSIDIDEKVEFLNKELLKTGYVKEEITNSTSNVYSTISYTQSAKDKLQDVQTDASGEEVNAHFGDTEGRGLGQSPDGSVTALRFLGWGAFGADVNAIWYKTDDGWSYLSWGVNAYSNFPYDRVDGGGWGAWRSLGYGYSIDTSIDSRGNTPPAGITDAVTDPNDSDKQLDRDDFDLPPTKVITPVSLDDPNYFPGNPINYLASLLDTATQGVDYLKGKADELIGDVKSGIKGAPKKLVNAAINAGVIRGFVAPAWKTLTNHQDNNDPTSKTFRNNDPTSSNYKGPKNVTSSFSSTQQSQITAQANHVLSMLNGGKGPSNPNGTLTPSEIEDFSANMNYPSGSYQSPGYSDDSKKAFNNTFHSLPVNTTTVNLQNGKLKNFDSNYQFSDPRDASVTGDFTGASEVIHGVTQQAVNNGVWKPGDDGEPYYQHSVDTHGRGPDNPIIGTQFNTQVRFSTPSNTNKESDQASSGTSNKDTKIASYYGNQDLVDIDGKGWYVTPDQLKKMKLRPDKYNLTPNQIKMLKRVKKDKNTGIQVAHYEPRGRVLSEKKDPLRGKEKWFGKKDVKPDYPEKAPPEMIDGWHPRLHKRFHPRAKDPVLKISKKDLNRQHLFKDDEIKEFTEMVDNINQLLDMQPELLPYVQQRYPANDTRLAALNYKMDIMLEAGKQYIDTHFPVNKSLFKRATESIKKNIKLTDPKHFKEVKEPPKYIHLKKYNSSKIIETVNRHFKNKKFHYKSWHKGHLSSS